jgi:Cu/Ag efflux pump CusA
MVLIGGLISSTLIARIVTPSMYLLLAPKDQLTTHVAAETNSATIA